MRSKGSLRCLTIDSRVLPTRDVALGTETMALFACAFGAKRAPECSRLGLFDDVQIIVIDGIFDFGCVARLESICPRHILAG